MLCPPRFPFTEIPLSQEGERVSVSVCTPMGIITILAIGVSLTKLVLANHGSCQAWQDGCVHAYVHQLRFLLSPLLIF